MANLGDNVRSLNARHAEKDRYAGVVTAKTSSANAEPEVQVTGENCPGIWFPESEVEVLP